MTDVLAPEDRFSGMLFIIEAYFQAPAGEDADRMLEELVRQWDDHHAVLRDNGTIFLKVRTFHSAVTFLRHQPRVKGELDALISRFIVAERGKQFDDQIQTLFTLFYHNCRQFGPAYAEAKRGNP